MTGRLQISEKTNLSDLKAFVQENKGKVAFAVKENGIEIYASDKAAAKPDAKGLGKAMGASAVSKRGQVLAKKAFYTSMLNTYGKSLADVVVESMKSDLMAPDASLGDLIDTALKTITGLFADGLDKDSELYKHQKALLDEAELAAKAKAAAGRQEAPKDQSGAAPNESKNVVPNKNPPPAFGTSFNQPPMASVSRDEDGNLVFGLKAGGDAQVTDDMGDDDEEEEPPLLLDPDNPQTQGLDLSEDDDDDDDETTAVQTAPQQASPQAKKTAKQRQSVGAEKESAQTPPQQARFRARNARQRRKTLGAEETPAKDAERTDDSVAAGVSDQVENLKADVAKAHDSLDKLRKTFEDSRNEMQETYDGLRAKVSASQRKRRARLRALAKKRGRARAASASRAMKTTYNRESLRKKKAQDFIETAEKGGGGGVPSFEELLEAANLPVHDQSVRKEAKEYILEQFLSYDRNDFSKLSNEQLTLELVRPVLELYSDLRGI